MMGPNQDWQCPGCTLEVSHVHGLLEYFEHHDMSYVAVARAPITEVEAVRRKMNWKFRWVSSSKSEFNYDFNVSFRPEEREVGRKMARRIRFRIGPGSRRVAFTTELTFTHSGLVDDGWSGALDKLENIFAK